MREQIREFAIPGLRWSLGLVLLWQSWLLLRGAISQIRTPAPGGPLPWIHLVLASTEIVAAVLFLVPRASEVGGCSLLLIFACAGGIHILHGEFHVGGLIVYAMAVVVCLTHGDGVARQESRSG